jgi:hypothetical protein
MDRRRRQLAAFVPDQWTDDGDDPTSVEDIVRAHARWRAARRSWWREHAPYGTAPPSGWEDARAFNEALARFRGQTAA